MAHCFIEMEIYDEFIFSILNSTLFLLLVVSQILMTIVLNYSIETEMTRENGRFVQLSVDLGGC